MNRVIGGCAITFGEAVWMISKLLKYVKILKSINYYFFYKARSSSYEVLLICHDANLSYKYNNKRYSPLLDSVSENLYKLDKSVLKIVPFSKYSDAEIFGKCLNIDDVWLGSIYFQSIKNRVLNRGIDFGHRKINAWDDVIKQINPKIIIAIQPPHELCIAARKNNIYTFDLQHGVISIDDNGYYSISYRAEYDQNGWPDGILCWDKNTKIWINERYQKFVTARVIGNPFILRFYKNDQNDTLVNESNQKLNKYLECDEKKKIIVTTQWGYEHLEGILKLGIPQSVIKMIKRRDEGNEWWIRFHPVTLKNLGEENVYRICSDEFSGLNNVHFKFPTTLPLPLLLNMADLHITYSSATVKEASIFSVKSAMLSANHENLKNWFSSEIEDGHAIIVNDSYDSLKQWILKSSIEKNFDTKELNKLSINYNEFIGDLSMFLETGDRSCLIK